MPRLFPLLASLSLWLPMAVSAQQAPAPEQLHHHRQPTPASGSPPPHDHEPRDDEPHDHWLGPAGATYDLRFIDAMVQHHTGALRMSELVFNIGEPAVGALAREVWSDQIQEIRAMGLWRRAWYPQAPSYPVELAPAADPDSLTALSRIPAERIAAMRMGAALPAPGQRVIWYLEGMLAHHGGALLMAHDALQKSRNDSVRRLARSIIVAQRREILQIRRMLHRRGFDRPAYHRFDRLFHPG